MQTPQEALKQYFGFDQFREGQGEAIDRVLKRQQTLLVMPTGSGKSLAYQLPAMMLPGLTLVISPLIALMKDQVDHLVEAGIPATYINSSLPSHEAYERMRAVLEGYVKLLYVAPERLRNQKFMQSLARIKLSLLAVDEAHCVSQWGHDFRPDYLRIGPAWEAMNHPTLIATTATATPAVQKQIVKLLGLKKAQIIVAGFNRPNLHLTVKHTPDDETKFQTLQSLAQKITQGSVIVYTATRKNCEAVAEFLRRKGMSAQAYHAGLDRNIRYRVQTEFMAGRLQMVVATNAFGMGVDKSDVRLVVHFNMPANVEAYYQEAGRAGRDGQAADCVMLYSPSDQRLQEFLIRSDTPSYEDMSRLYHLLAGLSAEGQAQATVSELGDRTNIFPTKLRVALSELEQAGLIIHRGTYGLVNQWQILPFSQGALSEREQAINARIESRLRLLTTMLNYSHLTTCRREFMLNYFGDVTPPKSPRCCDNHHDEIIENLPKAATPEEWYPLIVIETVNTLPRPVGRVKLADILMGSQSQQIIKFGYQQHKFFGKLGSRLHKRGVVKLIDQLIQKRYIKLAGGTRPILEVTPLGQQAIKHRAALPVEIVQQSVAKPAQSNNRSRRGDTRLETLALLEQGLSPDEIAEQRRLKLSTIYNHLAILIEQEKADINQFVATEIQTEIVAAIQQVGSTEVLFPIKVLLPDEIDYNQIRCVIAAHPDIINGERPTIVDTSDPIRRIVTMGATRDIQYLPELVQALDNNDGNIRRLAASALGKIGHVDAVKPLITLLTHETKSQVRQYAIKALGRLGDNRARPVLEQVVNSAEQEPYQVVQSAKTALKQLLG